MVGAHDFVKAIAIKEASIQDRHLGLRQVDDLPVHVDDHVLHSSLILEKAVSRQFAVLFGLLALMLGGCASVPDFRPSSPLGESETLEEGLLLCHEYEMPLLARRPVAMKPYVQCVNELLRLSEGWGAPSVQFQVFRRELNQFYDGHNDWTWREAKAPRIQKAIRGAMKGLWRGSLGGSYSDDEASALREFLPRTARVLGASRWKAESAGGGFHRGLERLKARANGLARADASASAERPGTTGVAPGLSAGIRYLNSYWGDLVRMPPSREREIASKRFAAHLSRLEDLLNARS